MSNEAKATHTPGPWTADGRWVRGPVGTLVGACARPDTPILGWQAEAEANARLIAAAPDLLAALKEWRDLDEKKFMVTGLLDRTRAAIAKAEGA